MSSRFERLWRLRSGYFLQSMRSLMTRTDRTLLRALGSRVLLADFPEDPLDVRILQVLVPGKGFDGIVGYLADERCASLASLRPQFMRHLDRVDTAIMHGVLHVLPDLDPLMSRVKIVGARAGRIAVLRWAHARDPAWPPEALNAAAMAGSIECMHFILSTGGTWINASEELSIFGSCPAGAQSAIPYEDLVTCAATSGSIPCIEFVLSMGFTLNALATTGAATHGHADALRWMIDRDCPVDVIMATRMATMNGTVECLKILEAYCHARGEALPLVDAHMDHAAERGDVDMIRWLWARSCPPSDRAMSSAARGNHAEAMWCLCMLGYSCDERACMEALPHVECLRIALDTSGVDPRILRDMAMYKASPESLHELVVRGVRWDDATLTAPLVVERIEVMHAAGCFS